jgi:peptide/nickel transport system permease protein
MNSQVLSFATRLILGALTVYTLVFFAFAVLPLDPVRSLLGPLADQQSVREMSERYGLDQPLAWRYFKSLGALLSGDFGISVVFGEPIGSLLFGKMAESLARFFVALALGAGLALIFAPRIVVRDIHWARYVLLAFSSTPAFVLMVLALVLLGALLPISPSRSPVTFELAAIVLAALYAASVIGLSLLDRLDFRVRRSRQADLLMLLRAPTQEMVEILLRGNLPGVLAVAANVSTGVLTTLTFAEFVFDLPGFSVTFIRACQRGDMAVVAFGSLALALILLVLQQSADIMARWVDRRLVSNRP